ncbi:hypothetical protein PR048_020827 [Dryococelus australis]|uniref:Uncharacterized protein n=1 Tax=Dryococelus australis TaxID=614101 RepID=A0ABQ9GWI1_9NEOP|nr:hypothetical protein PR048_020827 [Dryococelus australis]
MPLADGFSQGSPVSSALAFPDHLKTSMLRADQISPLHSTPLSVANFNGMDVGSLADGARGSGFYCDGYVTSSIYFHQCSTIDFFRHGADSTGDFFRWVTYSSSAIDVFMHNVDSAIDFFRHGADSTGDFFRWVTYSSSAIDVFMHNVDSAIDFFRHGADSTGDFFRWVTYSSSAIDVFMHNVDSAIDFFRHGADSTGDFFRWVTYSSSAIDVFMHNVDSAIDFFRHGADSTGDFFRWVTYSSSAIDVFMHNVDSAIDFFRHGADSTGDFFRWVTYSSSAIDVFMHNVDSAIDFFRHGADSTGDFFRWVTYSSSAIDVFMHDVDSAIDLYERASYGSSIGIANWIIGLCSSSVCMSSISTLNLLFQKECVLVIHFGRVLLWKRVLVSPYSVGRSKGRQVLDDPLNQVSSPNSQEPGCSVCGATAAGILSMEYSVDVLACCKFSWSPPIATQRSAARRCVVEAALSRSRCTERHMCGMSRSLFAAIVNMNAISITNTEGEIGSI